MDSDTDSDTDILPGWEKQLSNGRTVYLNHINQSSLFISPLKALNMKKEKNVSSKTNYEKFVQKFDSFSTSEQILSNSDLITKSAIVVGGCSGIGMEIVYQLISRNCEIVMGSPNISRCSENLIKKIGEDNFKSFVKMFELDLASFKSIQSFCGVVLKTVKDINLIVLSAGVMSPPYTITIDGFESTFQINILSEFYILETILEYYIHCKGECRVIWVACESHRAIKMFNLSHLEPTKDEYDGFYAYALSQLCKILIIRQLKIKWDLISSKKKFLFFSCHPGNLVSGTQITRHIPILAFIYWLFTPFTKNLSQSAATPLLCCISSSVKNFSGFYFNNCCICEPSTNGSNEHYGKLLMAFLRKKIKAIM